MSKFEQFLRETVKECNSYADFCRTMDLIPAGSNYAKIKFYIKKYNLNISHFANEPWNKGKSVKINQQPLEEILIENSNHLNQSSLKKRLFKAGLKKDICEICGREESNELHHINGNSTDNRIENLQILCPNCHSKTNNFKGKNSSIGRRHKSPQELILSEKEVKEREQKRRESRRIPIEKQKRKLLPDKICPICGKTFHPKSKTTKFCSVTCYDKERSKTRRPSYEELIIKLKENKGNFTAIGRFYGVTDNAVRKWCRLYQISDKSKDYYLKDYNNLLY